MVKLAPLFKHFKPCKILVAGDICLDHYIFGKASRISPEAPVPVVAVEQEDERPGGAGNVMLNLASLGMQVTALARVGSDVHGTSATNMLSKASIQLTGLFSEAGYKTSKKSRVIANAQQLVRIDTEEVVATSSALEKKVIAAIPQLLKGQDLVAISDYGKGFLTKPILAALITCAKKYKIPVVVDPKGTDFSKYAGATIIKPNLSEAYAVARFSPREKSLSEVALEIFKQVVVDVVMITRSEAGISLYYPNGKVEDHPVESREVRDVAGAGDTVLAMLCAAFASGLTLSEATALANIAATIAVERVGCVQVSLAEVARRAIELHQGHKVFSHEHLPALELALKDRQCVVLAIRDKITSTALLQRLRELTTTPQQELVVALEEKVASDELLDLLVSLKEIDYVHVGVNSVQELKKALSPSQMYQFSDTQLVQI